MRALITGVQGFTGRYLAIELHKAGYDVFGLAQLPDAVPPRGVKHVYACDLADPLCLTRVVAEVQPDVVIHLAAIAFVAHGDIDAMYRTNLIGSRHLLEALAQRGPGVRSVLLASSANVYGNATGGVLDERAQPAPANDYAVSKLAMEYLARLYCERLPIIVARPFNYTGLGQATSFLLPKIVSHAKLRAPVIELGNLDVARDFSDVRAVADVYRRLLEAPSAIGETFNVCSGHAYTLHDVLNMVRTLARYNFEVQVNPAFVRANEVKLLIGSRSKLQAVIGAMRDIPLSDTLKWMLTAKE